MTLRVDIAAGTATVTSPPIAHAEGASAPSFALLGINEIGAATSNFSRSSVGQFIKKMVRVRFDIALKNKLSGVALVPATFPQPPLGNQALMLFPYQISSVVGAGSAKPSTDWDQAPYNFFNDPSCAIVVGGASDCYRWEAYPAPLGPGVTSAARTVGFDVDPTVQSFVVTLVLAADLKNRRANSNKIAFSRSGFVGGLFTINPDGSGETRLTDDNCNCADNPTWSGDGTKIAFDLLGEIYIINGDGTGRTQITFDADDGRDPDWSPEASMITFWSLRDGNAEIYVMNDNGTGQTRLTNDAASDDAPTWSGDGTKIAFESNRGGNNDDIYIMNPDGSGQTRLTTIGGGSPSWSGDGSKIAFASSGGIWVMNADGSGQTRLTDTGDFNPTWSGDGTKIAFMTLRTGVLEIYVMNSDGSGQTPLVSGRRTLFNSEGGHAPDWSLD